jgi:hypothetical protein
MRLRASATSGFDPKGALFHEYWDYDSARRLLNGSCASDQRRPLPQCRSRE